MPGVQLQLVDAGKTLAWLKRGVAMASLGQTALPNPLSRLVVMAHAGSGEASLAALLFSPLPSPGSIFAALTGGGRIAMRPPYDALRAAFPSRLDDTALYILGPDGKKAFGVVPGPLPNQVTVFRGDLPLLQWITPALPLSTPDALQEQVAAFGAVVTATIAGLYGEAGLEPPDLVLRLQPGPSDADSVAREAAKNFGQVMDRVTGKPAPPGTTVVATDRPTERFSDVGGQESAVSELQGVLLAITAPERYRQWGARPPKGVLLYGPPGTGKTLLARCLAGEAGALFMHIRAADIASKWYGEAEQRMQAVFERARESPPAIIFFDEVDALAPHRDGAHEVTHRIVSTMLEYMDGMEALEGVVVIAATNRLDAIDAAILRPGRFDRLVEVDLPDDAGRRQILQIHCRAAERRAGRPLFADLDWDALTEAGDGLSGADLAEAVRRALEARVRGAPSTEPITTEELLLQVEELAEQAS